MNFIGTAEEARNALAGLVNPAVAPTLSSGDLDAALLESRLRDSNGVLPGGSGYIGTYSLFWAAAAVSEKRAILSMSSEQITKFSSEGSTFERAPVNWSRVAATFRAQAAADAGVQTGGLSVYGIVRQPAPATLSTFPHLTGVTTNAD